MEHAGTQKLVFRDKIKAPSHQVLIRVVDLVQLTVDVADHKGLHSCISQIFQALVGDLIYEFEIDVLPAFGYCKAS